MEEWTALCLPLHGEERVDHVVVLPLAPLQLLRQHVSHGALQQVRHLDVPVAVKHTIQSFTDVTEAVQRQSSDAQPDENTQGMSEEQTVLL